MVGKRERKYVRETTFQHYRYLAPVLCKLIFLSIPGAQSCVLFFNGHPSGLHVLIVIADADYSWKNVFFLLFETPFKEYHIV